MIAGVLLLIVTCIVPGLAQEPAFSFVYDVGPGQALATPSEVPWESLQPGTLIRIHYRDIPYNAKWVVAVSATASEPVVIRGIPETVCCRLLPVKMPKPARRSIIGTKTVR